jgi:hypothetical protein
MLDTRTAQSQVLIGLPARRQGHHASDSRCQSTSNGRRLVRQARTRTRRQANKSGGRTGDWGGQGRQGPVTGLTVTWSVTQPGSGDPVRKRTHPAQQASREAKHRLLTLQRGPGRCSGRRG